LPESDSESDAFSHVGNVEVRHGRVEARFGRKVKTTRPRINFAGTFDVMSLNYPTVVLKVKTDATGKVTSVSVLRSSGSVDLDHPVEMAMYDWWIEPPKDKHGKPIPDVMVWKISFR
jgi:TonB family protein